MSPPAPPIAPIKPNTELPDGSIVRKYLGRSEGGLSYFADHPKAGRVVVKVLSQPLVDSLEALRDEIETLKVLDHRSLQRLVEIGEFGGHAYMSYQYADGQALRSVIGTLAADGPPRFRPVYNVVGHLTTALEALHSVSPHGVLTSGNVFVQPGGRISIANIGFGRLMLTAMGTDSDAFRDSAYIAPEVREDPWSMSESSDMYSVGVICVALLSGEEPTRSTLLTLKESVTKRYPGVLRVLLDSCLAQDPGMRIASAGEFRQEMAAVLQAVRATRSEPSEPGLDLLPSSIREAQAAEEADDLFAGIELPNLHIGGTAVGGSGGEERWLVHRGGRDYGPYSEETIKEQLERDEIDEDTKILDMHTQLMSPLIDIETFGDFVIDYIPKREKRRMDEEERRDEAVRQVKRKSSFSVIAGGLGAVSVFAALFIVRSQMGIQPEPFPYEQVIQPFRRVFEVEEPSYTGIAADNDLIAALFNVDAPLPEEERRGGSSSSSGSSGGSDDDDEDYDDSDGEYVLDFDSSQPASRLSQSEINGTIRRNAGRMQGCFGDEMRSNPSFRGAEVTWSIRPDGHTFNIRVDGRMSSSTEQCIIRAFRRIRFPEFNDVPMNVSYPFYVQ